MKLQIPKSLLIAPPLNISKVKTQKDAGLMIIDLYEAYAKCILQLESIERINDE